MITFPIESGIPLPSNRGTSHEISYPFTTMECTDSFFVPYDVQKVEAVRASCYDYGKRHDLQFSVRKVKNPEGCRVWRVS